MAGKRVEPRAARAISWCVLALLAPVEAGAVTITGGGVNQTTSAQLGGGIGGGPCLGAPSCSDAQTNTGPVPLTVPTYSGIASQVSTSTGTNAVNADGNASVALYVPDPFIGPDAVLFGRLEASTSIRDSASTSFHTSAAAAASSDDFIQFAVPALLPGELFSMDVAFIAFEDDFTITFAGTLVVEDITTASVLASYDESDTGSVELDLTARAGHDIRLSLTSDLAMAGDEGFGGGADPLTQRSFSSVVFSDFILHHVVVPEPATAALLGAGLAILGLRRGARRG